jgi:hypothetical protein
VWSVEMRMIFPALSLAIAGVEAMAIAMSIGVKVLMIKFLFWV